MELGFANDVGNVQISLVWKPRDVNASAVVGLLFGGELNRAPHFGSGVIVEIGVQTERGAPPNPRTRRKAKRRRGSDVRVGVKIVLES